MGNQFHAQQFIDAIPGTGGIVTTIAKRVGCEWHTVKRYMANMPTIRRAYEDECERVLDIAESAVIKGLQAEPADGLMVRYYLSTKGKRRGYTERTETVNLTGADIDREIERELAKLAERGEAADVIPAEAENTADTGAASAV